MPHVSIYSEHCKAILLKTAVSKCFLSDLRMNFLRVFATLFLLSSSASNEERGGKNVCLIKKMKWQWVEEGLTPTYLIHHSMLLEGLRTIIFYISAKNDIHFFLIRSPKMREQMELK